MALESFKLFDARRLTFMGVFVWLIPILYTAMALTRPGVEPGDQIHVARFYAPRSYFLAFGALTFLLVLAERWIITGVRLQVDDEGVSLCSRRKSLWRIHWEELKAVTHTKMTTGVFGIEGGRLTFERVSGSPHIAPVALPTTGQMPRLDHLLRLLAERGVHVASPDLER